jgi:hypothetical protein
VSQHTRIEQLLRRVQGILATVFEFTIIEGGGTLDETDFFELDRPKRWRKADPLAFRLHFHAANIASRTDDQLATDLVHEIVHAITHDIYEKAHHRRHGPASDEIHSAWEAAAYQTERSIAPLVNFWLMPRWKRVWHAFVRSAGRY